MTWYWKREREKEEEEEEKEIEEEKEEEEDVLPPQLLPWKPTRRRTQPPPQRNEGLFWSETQPLLLQEELQSRLGQNHSRLLPLLVVTLTRWAPPREEQKSPRWL